MLAFVAAVAFVLVRADQFLGDGAVHMKTMLPYVRVWNEEEGEKMSIQNCHACIRNTLHFNT